MKDSDAEALRLTFAELEYLLANSSTWPGSREVLGLQEPTSEGVAAGLASLIVRGYAHWGGNDVELSPDIKVATGAINATDSWAEIFFRTADRTLISYLGMSPLSEVRVMASLVAPGCYEIDALNVMDDPNGQAVSLVLGLIGTAAPSMVTVRFPSRHASDLSIGRNAHGEWALIPAGGGENALTPIGRADVEVALKSAFTDLHREA